MPDNNTEDTTSLFITMAMWISVCTPPNYKATPPLNPWVKETPNSTPPQDSQRQNDFEKKKRRLL